MLGQLVISGLLTGSIYALVALGMTVLFRSTTIVNFCHGEFFMVGAFAVYVTHHGAGWSYPASVIFAFALLFVFGMAVERGLIRPLRNAPHVALAMMTVALSFLLKGVARFFFGRDVSSLPPLLEGEPVSFAGVVLARQDLLVIGVSLLTVGLFFLFFQRTQVGKIIQAASQNPRGAALVGINVPRFHNVMWGASALMGALAGVLIAPSTLVYPDMGTTALIRAFAAMTLGGFGSLPGAVVGGLTMGIVENLAGGYVSSSLVEITAFIVIILVLLVRPQGLLGEGKASAV
jgi:branched-chain amino acid transport system permease protein